MPLDGFLSKHAKWFFADCFTIDPSRGAAAWEKLNANQLGLEVGMLPQTLHTALLETLAERKTLERSGRAISGRAQIRRGS